MVFEVTKLCRCKNSLRLISELQVSHQINGFVMHILQGVLENVSDKVCRVHSTGTQQAQISSSDCQERNIFHFFFPLCQSDFSTAIIIQVFVQQEGHRYIFKLASGRCRVPCALALSFLRAQGFPMRLAWPQSDWAREARSCAGQIGAFLPAPGSFTELQCFENMKHVEEGFIRQFLLCPHTKAALIMLDCTSTQVLPEQVIN